MPNLSIYCAEVSLKLGTFRTWKPLYVYIDVLVYSLLILQLVLLYEKHLLLQVFEVQRGLHGVVDFSEKNEDETQ